LVVVLHQGTHCNKEVRIRRKFEGVSEQFVAEIVVVSEELANGHLVALVAMPVVVKRTFLDVKVSHRNLLETPELHQRGNLLHPQLEHANIKRAYVLMLVL
jgi:hypothetical protein